MRSSTGRRRTFLAGDPDLTSSTADPAWPRRDLASSRPADLAQPLLSHRCPAARLLLLRMTRTWNLMDILASTVRDGTLCAGR